VIVIADGAGIALTASGALTAPGALTGPGAFGGPRDLGLFSMLMACEVGGVELTRRAGEKAGISRDMHAVWELPVAILLPLAYAPLSPVIRIALTQWRVRHGSLHRRVFSAAALGLSYLAASFVFHGLAGTVNGLTQSPFRHGFAWMLIAAVAGVVQRVVNSALVVAAARGSDRAVRLRDAQFGCEPLYNDMAELCLAVLASFGVASSPIALVFSFPFASLPLRTVLHAQLVSDSRTDSKTGLLNAGAWQRDAAAAVGRAVRAGEPLAVAVLDLDWFKLINDTYGHLFGDEVLHQIGLCLPGALRDYDLAGRFGGEEFVLLLPSTRAADAHRVAERVRCRIAGLPLRAPNGDSVTVTASVGVAALAEGSGHELTDLLAAADAALYQAKRDGRNHVRMFISPARGLTGPAGLAGGLDGPRDFGAPRALPSDVVPAQPGSPEAVTRTGLPQPGDLLPGRTGPAAPRTRSSLRTAGCRPLRSLPLHQCRFGVPRAARAASDPVPGHVLATSGWIPAVSQNTRREPAAR